MKKLILFSILSSLYFSAPIASQTNQDENLPDIGIAASSALTLDKEKLLGDIIMRMQMGQGGVLQDPVLQDYLQDIGNRLVVLADDVNFPFTFFFVNNPNINAFAFFGGHIGINTGLIAAADNESELASVLAHEIAHVTQRHLARRIESQQQTTSMPLAALAAGALLAIGGGSDVILAAMMGGLGMMSQSSINYTRKNEREADRIGMRIIKRSPYDPTGASTFFGKLAAKNRYNSKTLAYLRTHPLALDRVADSRARAGASTSNSASSNTFTKDQLHFELAKARINVRYQKQANWVSFYQNEVKKHPNKPSSYYGLALAYFENSEYKLANQTLSMLRFKDNRNLFYIDLAADIAIATRQYPRAEKMLQAQRQQQPTNRVLILNLANVLLKAKKYQQAITLLRDFTLTHPADVLTRQLLIEGYEKTNKRLDVQQEKAEMYALMGAYEMSVDHLHDAYNLAAKSKNTLEMKRINARIGQFKKQLELAKNL